MVNGRMATVNGYSLFPSPWKNMARVSIYIVAGNFCRLLAFLAYRWVSVMNYAMCRAFARAREQIMKQQNICGSNEIDNGQWWNMDDVRVLMHGHTHIRVDAKLHLLWDLFRVISALIVRPRGSTQSNVCLSSCIKRLLAMAD